MLFVNRVKVNFTANYIDYMPEWARRSEGKIIQRNRKNEYIFLNKKPIGIIMEILHCKFFFPFFLIALKMASALVIGNTIASIDLPINAVLFSKVVYSSRSDVSNELAKSLSQKRT